MFALLKRLSDLLAFGGKTFVSIGSTSLFVAVAIAKLLIALDKYGDEDFEWKSDVDVGELPTFDNG